MLFGCFSQHGNILALDYAIIPKKILDFLFLDENVSNFQEISEKVENSKLTEKMFLNMS